MLLIFLCAPLTSSNLKKKKKSHFCIQNAFPLQIRRVAEVWSQDKRMERLLNLCLTLSGFPLPAVTPRWLMEPSLLPGRHYKANPKGSVQFHHCGQWHCAQGCNLSNEWFPAPKVTSKLGSPGVTGEAFCSPAPSLSQQVEGLNCFFFFLILFWLHLLGSRLTGDILTHNALSGTMRCPLPSLLKVLPSLQNKQRNCIKRAQLRAECTSKQEPLGDSSDESRFQWTLCFEACFLSACKDHRRNIPLASADTKECWGWEILSGLPVPQPQSSGCVLEESLIVSWVLLAPWGGTWWHLWSWRW